MNRIINYLFDVVRGVLFYFSQTKLRTALTLLGITVGVSSIIAIMTVLRIKILLNGLIEFFVGFGFFILTNMYIQYLFEHKMFVLSELHNIHFNVLF